MCGGWGSCSEPRVGGIPGTDFTPAAVCKPYLGHPRRRGGIALPLSHITRYPTQYLPRSLLMVLGFQGGNILKDLFGIVSICSGRREVPKHGEGKSLSLGCGRVENWVQCPFPSLESAWAPWQAAVSYFYHQRSVLPQPCQKVPAVELLEPCPALSLVGGEPITCMVGEHWKSVGGREGP